MAPTFYFLRHGEATHNVAFHEKGAGIFKEEAYRDAPLTEKGKDQAHELAKSLAGKSFAAIWSSPLTRCIQTAEEVFEEVDCNELYLHDNLLERQGNGHLMNERKSKQELKADFCIWKNTYLADRPAVWISHENDYALRQRMFMLVMLLADIYKEETDPILLVGHADAIQALTGRSLKNAELCSFTLEELMAL